MALTESQKKHFEILSRYLDALEHTREAYLDVLKKTNSKEDITKIININFVLNCMIENQRKCIQFLESLKYIPFEFIFDFLDCGLASIVLDSLDDNPYNNVDLVLTLMQRHQFKDSLTRLSNLYSDIGLLSFLGGIVLIATACIAAIFIVNTILMLVPVIFVAFTGLFLLASTTLCSATAKYLDSSVIPLVTDIPKKYSLDASYTYDQKESARGGDIVTVETVFHPSTSIAAVKASFFQKVDGHSSLAEEVQENFTSLAQAVGV